MTIGRETLAEHLDPVEEGADNLPDESAFGEICNTILKNTLTTYDADLYVYSGEINRRGATAFIDIINTNRARPNVILVLTTYGGDADAAFIIARHIKRVYSNFHLYVLGQCKSAGTLLALGADEIFMNHHGELGPLDVQLMKDDEIGRRSSGLAITQALQSLSESAYTMFERHYLELKFRSYGALTTKTAAEIACSLTVGLLSPITAQIDPLRIGEINREVSVAVEYGYRLCRNLERVERLVKRYPSHSFVIDFDEAEEIFQNVHLLADDEMAFALSLSLMIDSEFKNDYTQYPFDDGDAIIIKIDPFDDNAENGLSEEDGDADHNRGDSATQQPETTEEDSRAKAEFPSNGRDENTEEIRVTDANEGEQDKGK